MIVVDKEGKEWDLDKLETYPQEPGCSVLYKIPCEVCGTIRAYTAAQMKQRAITRCRHCAGKRRGEHIRQKLASGEFSYRYGKFIRNMGVTE